MTVGLDPRAVGLELRLAHVGRENIESKARRYLIEGRVSIVAAHSHHVTALVTGTENTHHVERESSGRWVCSCPARGRCCHIAACQLVTQRPGAQGARRRA